MLPYQDQSCPYIDGQYEWFDNNGCYESIWFDVYTSQTEFDFDKIKFYFWHPTNPGLHWEIWYDYSLTRVTVYRFSGSDGWPDITVHNDQLDTLESLQGYMTQTFSSDPDLGTVDITTDPYENDPLNPDTSRIRFTLEFYGWSDFPEGYIGAEILDKNENEACTDDTTVTSWGNTTGASPRMGVGHGRKRD